ncbi:MAG TPA: hypothetical protein VK176_03105 [Phycisphaerales bacterium]|nr:hypothetical protein [Phycisphaerales bacterium]
MTTSSSGTEPSTAQARRQAMEHFGDANSLVDVLANARHWCDQQNLSFAELDRIAYEHYLHERGNAGTSA